MQFHNTHNNWGWLAIGFHWITAITIVVLFILGLWMVELTYYDDWYKTAPYIHKSIGVSLFLLSLARISWRGINITPDTLNTHSAFEKKRPALYISCFTLLCSAS